ncbi:hypothetical protein TrST_g11616 [Triparma strigata]|uniref:Uncharacterized protein n=1 Tax=Triparma strigata TaxID=1606541 RepID=A0A9W7ENM9_9STRA|nr:hypothetical protein TrST_g11616 [Triparma strigata]
MSWESDGLSPVVVMYNIDGDINAIFFASGDVQQGMFSTNEWEPVPLPEFAIRHLHGLGQDGLPCRSNCWIPTPGLACCAA